MPMMQNPDGTMTRLPYPGEPGYGGGMGSVPGRQMPGMGYDQYLPMLRQQMMAPPMRVRMPAAPPRVLTPGRMDGMREARPKMPRDMMGIGMGGAMMPPMMGM